MRQRHNSRGARSGRIVDYGVELCFKLAKVSLAFAMPLSLSVPWTSKTGKLGSADPTRQILDANLRIENTISKYLFDWRPAFERFTERCLKGNTCFETRNTRKAN